MLAKKDIAYTIQEQINSHLKQIEKIKEEKIRIIEKYDNYISTQKEIIDFLKTKSPKASTTGSYKIRLAKISSKVKKRSYTLPAVIEEGISSVLKDNPQGIMISEIKKFFESKDIKVSLGALDRNIKKMLSNKTVKKLNPEANIGIKYGLAGDIISLSNQRSEPQI